MANYKQSRNLEASLIDFVTTELANAIPPWTYVSTEKTFARVYDAEISGTNNKAIVCIRTSDTKHDKVEIGSDSTTRGVLVFIDIFASNNGQKLDLKDFLVSKLKLGCIYYEYITSGGAVQSKTANGRIRVLSIVDTPIDFNVVKENLDIHDRHRVLITMRITTGEVES